MEENTERIAQLLLVGGDETKVPKMEEIATHLTSGDINQKIDKIASLFSNTEESKNHAKFLLEGGLEENFLNYDQKLNNFLESEAENNKYFEIGQKLIGAQGQKEDNEINKFQQISQVQLLGAGHHDIDDNLLKVLNDHQFEGKISTRQELKEMDPKKTQKLMNVYQEYVEHQTERDSQGLPKIVKVNNYDLSNYLRTVSELTMSGQKFKDSSFVPGKSALLGDGSNKDGLKWLSGPNAVTIFRRCSEIFGENNFKLFKGGIEPQDMNQGNIGNCYFMGSIAALAETPSRIQKLFVNLEANPHGCYAINVCEQGLWREIIIDDYIPCYKSNGKPAFAHNNGDEIWAMLIEKVWAKMYGGYANIIGGLGREVFNEMTGAPCQTLPTKNPSTFDEIYKGEKYNWPMCAASNVGKGTHDNKTAGGIANCHLYTMLGGYQVNYKGQTVQLVRLRNPWGKCEWNGAFGDNWAGWSDQALKQQLPQGYEKKDDGIFYMTYQDFQKEFSHVDICMYFDNYLFTALQIKTEFNVPRFFEVEIKTPGSYFFLSVQKSNRKFTKRENYKYSPISLTLAFEKQDMIHTFRYAKNPASYPNIDQWIFCQHIDPGKYILGVKCAWYNQKPNTFTLKSYGIDHVTLNNLNPKRYQNLKF